MLHSGGWILLMLLGVTGLSVASPVPSDGVEPQRSPATNSTQASTPTAVIPAKLQKEDEPSAARVDKARECTMKVLENVLSKTGETVSDECREVLRTMMSNVGKHKENRESDSVADLRKELKDLAKKEEEYERMNSEINEAQELFAEKRFSKPDDLTEVENPHIDNAALLAMESEKKATDDDEGGTVVGERRKGEPGIYRFPLGQNGENGEENFRDGSFSVDNSGVGILQGPDNGKDGNIDDDFLIIPLRLLRKQLLLKGNSAQDRQHAGKSDSNHEENTNSLAFDDNESDAAWLLRAMLDIDGIDHEKGQTEFDLPESGKFEAKPPVENSEKGKSNQNQERAANSREEVDMDAAEPEVKDDLEKKIPAEVREFNRDVLKRVETDISQLGEDLRQLQFKN